MKRSWVALALVLVVLGVLVGLQVSHTVRAELSGEGTICRVEVDDRVVALSFDDGPDSRYTQPIAEALARRGQGATFFVLGAQASIDADLVDRVHDQGFEIANHTWSHPRLTELELSAQLDEMQRTEAFLKQERWESTGRPLFRPPYGEIEESALRAIRDLGLTVVRWTFGVDRYLGTLDMSPQDASAAIMDRIRPGDIVLAHDGSEDGTLDRSGSVETAMGLSESLHEAGFEVVSVGELLGRGTPVENRAKTWFWQDGLECA